MDVRASRVGRYVFGKSVKFGRFSETPRDLLTREGKVSAVVLVSAVLLVVVCEKLL